MVSSLALSACSPRDPDTRLLRAIQRQDSAAVIVALKDGAHLEKPDDDGWTPLLHASAHGTAQTVNALLAAGADKAAVTRREKQPAITLAARWNHDDVVAALISGGANLRQRDSIGWTALMWASLQGRTKVAGMLIDGGADPQNRDSDGNTPLILAARRGHEDTVRLLLEQGARPEAQNAEGETAASLAKKSGYPALAALIAGRR